MALLVINPSPARIPPGKYRCPECGQALSLTIPAQGAPSCAKKNDLGFAEHAPTLMVRVGRA